MKKSIVQLVLRLKPAIALPKPETHISDNIPDPSLAAILNKRETMTSLCFFLIRPTVSMWKKRISKVFFGKFKNALYAQLARYLNPQHYYF